MRKVDFILASLFILFIGGQAHAQAFNAYSSLLYPLSINAQALGEQGVTLHDPADAMQYNPAALVYSPNLTATFFINPFKLIAISSGLSFPMASYVVGTKLPGIGSVGLQYTDNDLGTFVTTTVQNPDGGTVYHEYEQTFSIGFAREMSRELSLGLQLRYASTAYEPAGKADNLFVSAGLLYEPKIFERRLGIGFSLTNFGSNVKYSWIFRSAAAPSEVDLGVRAFPVNNDYFDIDLLLGASKILHKQSASSPINAESSFEALFNDWESFPNAMTAHAGLEFAWHPIPLGGGVFFIQKMYLGYFTTGPKELYNSFYTNGVDIGIQACGITATAGYAGRWQNNNAGSYLFWDFPWETFQFTLAGNINLFGNSGEGPHLVSPFKKVIVSAGLSYGSFLGRMKGGGPESSPGNAGPIWGTSVTSRWSPTATFSVAADFYFNRRMALTTSFGYTELKARLEFTEGYIAGQIFDANTETLFITSGLRYHPIDAFEPLFVEGDIGIDRLNPIQPSLPRYYYESLTDVLVGAALQVPTTEFVFTPEIGLRTLYGGVGPSGSRLGGFNQVIYSINVGYRL